MEMDEQRIGMVQVRASELRSKIANCIPKTPQTNPILQDDPIEDGDNNYNTIISNGVKDPSSLEVVDDEEDAETLLNICDAFDSLESQLNALQELQQQQQYERQAVIADIEYSRKMLLKKLGDYKGVHMDVIQEAEAFASMNVEHDNELLLPPYSTRTRSLVLDNNHLSRSSYNRKLAQNGYNGNDATNESKKSQSQSSSSRLWGGLRFLVHSTAKTMVTLVGVISLLRLAGFEPRLSKKGANLKILSLIQPGMEEKRLTADCPPGKVAVMEDGEIRCIVKERVEIPFDSVAGDPDVNYGCG